jgi:hypothetical protein
MNNHQLKDDPFVAMVLVRAYGTPITGTAPTISLYHS